MFIGKIKSVKKAIAQVDNSEFLDVEVEISKDEEVVEVRKLAFPLNAVEKEIKAELKKYMKTYNSDFELAEASKERDKAHANADKVIEKMTGAAI
jgi:uncharacterized protein involved in exopolysaccharide biosynthesis